MKIIYRGGYHRHDPSNLAQSLWFAYQADIRSILDSHQRVAVVVLAKPDGFFQTLVDQLPAGVEVIDSRRKTVDWFAFDFILIPGGETRALYDALVARRFSLAALKPEVTIVGDSAGAYVLSSYFYERHPDGPLTFQPGFHPAAKIITKAHIENPHHTTPELLAAVETFAADHQLKLIRLRENETWELTA